MTKSIAIIGGGIVGATAAFYLSEAGYSVTVFDEGTGQATSAAAGIICPWLSKRRNKKWYRLASDGAAFYQTLLSDLEKRMADTSFYTHSGAVLLKKTLEQTKELYELGVERRKLAPEIGTLTILNEEQLLHFLPSLKNQKNGLYVGGGARVEGSKLVHSLLTTVQQNGGQIIPESVQLEKKDDTYVVRKNNKEVEIFDKIILAAGAWLPQLLEPLDWKVDIRGQKGQLVVLQTKDQKNDNLPVLIPTGEIDILPVGKGIYYVGASHENEKGYDLTSDKEVINQLIHGGTEILASLQNATLVGEKVGTRAYTSDFSPFFGYLPTSTSILVASGLGSSGLTTGPYIGFQLALLAQGKPTELSLEDYDSGIYLKNMNKNDERI